MEPFIYKSTSTNEELNQILDLQKLNLNTLASQEERQSEGFITVRHDFKILKAMNDRCAHTIAKFNDQVVGYAISMVKEFKDDIPVLIPMFNKINSFVDPNLSYIVMGQICIDKAFRKQGLFRGLYNAMKEHVKHEFDTIITEVDEKNKRSLYAHHAIGFKTIHIYRSNNQNWHVISWDINTY